MFVYCRFWGDEKIIKMFPQGNLKLLMFNQSKVWKKNYWQGK